MFTGIVEELGRVRAIVPRAGGARLELACTEVIADASIGDSIAVNGCCLTVVELGDNWWAADAQIETLDRTTLGALAAVRAAGRQGEVLLVGFDNISAIRDAVARGDVLATADQHADQLAVYGIEVALEIVRDGRAPEDRETRGFISITRKRPSSGFWANCTFEPPVSTPIFLSTAIEASRSC